MVEQRKSLAPGEVEVKGRKSYLEEKNERSLSQKSDRDRFFGG